MKSKFMPTAGMLLAISSVISAGVAYGAAPASPVASGKPPSIGNNTAPPSAPSGVVRPPSFDKMGIQVLSYTKGPSGLNIWKVQKDGVQTVFYSTSDNKTLISGVMWDAVTAQNLSDQYLPDDPKPLVQAGIQPAGAQTPVAAAPAAVDPNGIPIAVKNLSTYFGFKEGRGAVDKTLYIVFDPRCPYCHQAYTALREQVRKGVSVMWIPVAVLGDVKVRQESMRWIAEAQKEKDPTLAIAKLFNKQFKGSDIGKDLVQNLIKNEMFLQASYRENPAVGTVGVPTAYYATKDNAPNMIQVGDAASLKIAIDTLKK